MKNYFILILFFISTNSFCQTDTIDLASNLHLTITYHHGKEFEIFVKNKLIDNAQYEVVITKKSIPMALLDLKDITPIHLTASRSCNLPGLANDLLSITEEIEIPDQINIIKQEIKNVENGTSSCTASDITNAQTIINKTISSLGKWQLQKGEQLEVIITRTTGTVKKWTRTYTAEPRGEWQVSYGFSFITQLMSEGDHYYSSPADSGFRISKEENRRKMTFAPSLFFTWVPTMCLNVNWNIGLSGGLGFDFENPTVFLGPTISYNQNLKLHLGLVAHKQKFLLGKYKEGDNISMSLDHDQLHEELYRLNPFFSLSFRFAQNPFNPDTN